MPSVLVHAPDDPVTLSPQAVKRLLDRGDGDAALLYLALLRRHGDTPPRSLAGELRWDKGRIEAAEASLRDLGSRPVGRALLSCGVFRRAVLIEGAGAAWHSRVEALPEVLPTGRRELLTGDRP